MEAEEESAFIPANLVAISLSWLLILPFGSAFGTYVQAYMHELGATAFYVGVLLVLNSIASFISRIFRGT